MPVSLYNNKEKKKLNISKEERWNRLCVTKREIVDQREKEKIDKDAK